MSTYKELCAVANEMGQPDMIYKFLNLASHHALWNTKKGNYYIILFFNCLFNFTNNGLF